MKEMTSKFVVHCRKWPYDVYIGRPSLAIRRDIPCSDGRWGNPFVVGKDGATREQVIAKHREWLVSNKELMNQLPELKGKVLGSLVCTFAVPWRYVGRVSEQTTKPN